MIKTNSTYNNWLVDPTTLVPTGFVMRFDNGNTISIQWGKGCYGSYRNEDAKDHTFLAEVLIGNENVEIADSLIEPMGWCDSDMVASLIHEAATLDFEELEKMYGKEK